MNNFTSEKNNFLLKRLVKHRFVAWYVDFQRWAIFTQPEPVHKNKNISQNMKGVILDKGIRYWNAYQPMRSEGLQQPQTLNLHWTMEVLSHSGPSFQPVCVTTLCAAPLVESTELKSWQLLLLWQANSSPASLDLWSHLGDFVALPHSISCLLEGNLTSLLRQSNLKRYATSSYYLCILSLFSHC
jgi:hypothetical protein